MVNVPGTSWVHSGAYGDMLDWYYIVRAFNPGGGESTNSTMGVKAALLFGTVNPDRNINWFSLPYNTMYTTASDIATELGPGKINLLGKWDPAKQKSEVYYLGRSKWRGKNFDINPGDGLFLNSVNPMWDWVVNGTDYIQMLSFNFNPPGKANINWVSLPYTNNYVNASQLVLDIEGSLTNPPTKITEVAMWDPGMQDVMTFYWNSTAGQWEGFDFPVVSWFGYALDVISSFTWTPQLITPPVPP